MNMFPEIEPYAHGLLDVGDGQQLYWETCGNPDGKPVVTLHGGPGSGCTSNARRFFDPGHYRIVLFDQRGAGRSIPKVDATTDLTTNTTAHLIADIERLRDYLGVERWLVRGSSWGSTLALAYAQQFPQRVSEIVITSVTMTRPQDVHWLTHQVGRFYPADWERFRTGVPEGDRNGDLMAAYWRLLHVQPDLSLRVQAATDWCAWEDAIQPLPGGGCNPRYADPAFRMTFARLVTHYFYHAAWLEEGQLLRDAHRLRGIPGVLVHGRQDLAGPLDVAWHLARAWPDAELQIVETGHAGGAEMTARLVEATTRFSEKC